MPRPGPCLCCGEAGVPCFPCDLPTTGTITCTVNYAGGIAACGATRVLAMTFVDKPLYYTTCPTTTACDACTSGAGSILLADAYWVTDPICVPSGAGFAPTWYLWYCRLGVTPHDLRFTSRAGPAAAGTCAGCGGGTTCLDGTGPPPYVESATRGDLYYPSGSGLHSIAPLAGPSCAPLSISYAHQAGVTITE